MLLTAECYPQRLVLLIHPDRSVRFNEAQLLRSNVEAMSHAMDSDHPVVQSYTKKSPFHTPLMRTALAIIAACHWDAEHAEVRWLVSTICGGMNQTRISEEAHKVMRSQEAGSGQKTLSHLRSWQAPSRGGVIAAYGMTEVTPVDVANTYTSGDLSKLFDSRLVDRTLASAHTQLAQIPLS
eukprot:6490915-Amphidinium_carterae.1